MQVSEPPEPGGLASQRPLRKAQPQRGLKTLRLQPGSPADSWGQGRMPQAFHIWVSIELDLSLGWAGCGQSLCSRGISEPPLLSGLEEGGGAAVQ